MAEFNLPADLHSVDTTVLRGVARSLRDDGVNPRDCDEIERAADVIDAAGRDWPTGPTPEQMVFDQLLAEHQELQQRYNRLVETVAELQAASPATGEAPK